MVLDQVPVGVSVFQFVDEDPQNGKIVFANERSAFELGFDLKPFEGKLVSDAFPRPSEYFSFAMSLDDGQVLHLPRQQASDNAKFQGGWFDLTVIGLGDGFVMFMGQNVTEIVDAEQKIDELNARLQSIAGEFRDMMKESE